MQKRHNTIKVKVIGWSILAALAVLLTGVISYNSYRQLLSSLGQTSNQETKLMALGDILTDITEAEAKMRAYALTRDGELLENYQQLVSGIEGALERVKTITPIDQDFNLQVDSVSRLLNDQTSGVAGFIELKRTLNQLSFSTKALTEIGSSTDSIPALTTTTTTTTTTTRLDPVVEEENADDKKKNTKRQQRKRVQEIAKALSELEKEPQIQTETTTSITIDTSFVQSDTIMDNIQQILVDIGREEEWYQQVVARKELQLIESSILIIDQIRGLIGSLEKQELALNIEKANNAKLIASRSTLTISIIIFICLILGIIFTYWIFRDVRIRDFYNKQLIGAKQQAEQLADSKQQFLATMSHEIRTPLNAIIGFTEQLGNTKLEPEQRNYLSAVHSSSQHLLSTVNDILDYSKIEAGELRISREPFEITAAIEEVISTLRIKAEEKGLDLIREVQSESPIQVMGDPFRLKQIMYNLVSNGLKFTEKGYVKIIASCETTADTTRLTLVVKDSGIGIPEEKHQEIFSDFKQIDHSSTRRFQGTGLGLAICKRLVELQGGTIGVDSNKPQGTVFTVELPYETGKDQHEVINAANLSKATDAAVATENLKGLRVLVADDDPFNIQLIKSLLEKWQADATYCSDGKQAMQEMENNSYQLVLTDINMPKASGLELSQFLRSLPDPQKRSLPIIALTANVMEDDLKRYKKAGINDFVLKPFKAQELLNKINEVVRQIDPTDPAAALPGTGYNLDDLRRFSGGDQEAFRPILETFYENLKQNMDALSNQARQQNHHEVAELAHKMISSFGHLQATEPMDKLRTLETAIKSNNLERPIEEMVEEIIQVAQPVLEGLEQDIAILA